ncbi:MAG: hypothetical protein HC875_12080 [Anaerolineales bacterium]|nr:hypothetical protein [Anaerolineales bacterium]
MATKRFTQNDRGAADKFGQLIGESFEKAVVALIQDYLQTKHTEYVLLEPKIGRAKIELEMFGGSIRQLDTVVMAKDSEDPVALLETKWLKDARHHNDKGAWILQLREVKKKYATVRGAAAVLAGYWTEGVGVILMSEGGIKMVWVATDTEVYGTIQQPLDSYLGENTFKLEAHTIRKSYPRPWDLANLFIELKEKGELERLASTWLEFERAKTADGRPITGADLIRQAIDELLTPLPSTPNVKGFEVALRIDTGNLIYQEFDDIESLFEFVNKYHQNPQEILRRITPRKKAPTEPVKPDLNSKNKKVKGS